MYLVLCTPNSYVDTQRDSLRNTSLLEMRQLNPFHVLSSSLHKNNFNIILGLPSGVYTLGFHTNFLNVQFETQLRGSRRW